jgi:sugar O-acyltransferase (sialic acid O-acetyltransferase NeuD family)
VIKIVVVGAGGQARVVSSIIEKTDDYDIVGFLDNVETSVGEKIGQRFVLGSHKLLPELYKQNIDHAIVAVGDNIIRSQHFSNLRGMKYKFINAIHPSAIIENTTILGTGNVIAMGVMISCYATIKDNCIINTGAIIDHETVINDNVHIAPGVNIAGRVVIGEYTTVGIGSVIKDYVTVGKNVTIGAGSVVIKDISDNAVVAGIPAKLIRHKDKLS